MRSWAYNRFGVLMGASWLASGLRWPSLRVDVVPMITLFPSQGYFCATAALHSSDAETPPIVGCEALLALVNWSERRRHHDPANALQDLAARATGSATSTHCPAESDGHTAPGHDRSSGGDAQ